MKDSTPLGNYYVLACADDTGSLNEYSESQQLQGLEEEGARSAAGPLAPGFSSNA